MASRFVRRSSRPAAPELEAELDMGRRCPQTLVEAAQVDEPIPECRVEVGHFTALNWGGRHDNEDRMMSHRDAVPGGGGLAFRTFGVLDGHDTARASDMVSRCLPPAVARKLRDGVPVNLAFTEAMEEMEEGLKKLHSTAGTCVNAVLVAGPHVWCANLGDCRSGLFLLQETPIGRTGSPVGSGPKVERVYWLSRDHKASCPLESKRIKELGWTVTDGRVEGLEPSRTLGDFDVKMQVNKGVISIVPDLRRYRLGQDESSQALIVCGTDGVWDVLSGQDVCNIIAARRELSRLQAGASAPAVLSQLAEDLVQFSIARGSRDDCTAVVAFVSLGPASEAVPAESDAPRPRLRE